MKRLTAFLFVCVAFCTIHVAFALDFTGLTGGGVAVPNVQPSLTMNFMVRTDLSSYYALGEVGLFAGSVVPNGWTVADGRSLNIASHTSLYDALGTTYGGDGTTTFALPDLRGRAAFGTGTGTGLSTRLLGANFGAEHVTFATAQLPTHQHTLPEGGVTAIAGSGQSQQNVQPGLALNFGLRTSGEVTGQINLFAGKVLPVNDIPADGRLLPLSQNTALFSLLGTTYGGDGASNFAAPDLRGRVAIHAGQGVGLSARTLGVATGSDQVILTTSEMPAHSHMVPNSTTVFTETTGGNLPQPNMGPSLTLNYLIATSGLDPNSQSANDGIYLGQLLLFAGNFAPNGFEFADGQLLTVDNYPDLFSILGSTYGGDGLSTFALPDLRGRVPIDVGAGAGLTSRTLGSTSGAEAVTLSVANLPSHAHAVSIPGDFNFNGVVNAADYVVWRDGLGTVYTQDDYSVWRAHFGQGLSPGSGASDEEVAAVPEPATCVLVLAFVPVLKIRRCTHRR